MEYNETNEKSECPYCGHKHELATDLRCNAKPSPGDVSICIQCANVLMFDDNLATRKPTDNELEKALRMPAVVQTVAAIIMSRAEFNYLKKHN